MQSMRAELVDIDVFIALYIEHLNSLFDICSLTLD